MFVLNGFVRCVFVLNGFEMCVCVNGFVRYMCFVKWFYEVCVCVKWFCEMYVCVLNVFMRCVCVCVCVCVQYFCEMPDFRSAHVVFCSLPPAVLYQSRCCCNNVLATNS